MGKTSIKSKDQSETEKPRYKSGDILIFTDKNGEKTKFRVNFTKHGCYDYTVYPNDGRLSFENTISIARLHDPDCVLETKLHKVLE